MELRSAIWAKKDLSIAREYQSALLIQSNPTCPLDVCGGRIGRYPDRDLFRIIQSLYAAGKLNWEFIVWTDLVAPPS